MARYGRGLICLSMTPERLDELEIPLMVSQNSSRFDTGVLRAHRGEASDDAPASPRPTARRPCWRRSIRRRGRRISRGPATCSRCARGPAACWCAPDRPKRRSISRGSPGLYPAGVICEVMNEDGTMARVPQLTQVREAPRAADGHRRGPDQVPDAHRVAREARRVREDADRPTATSGSTRSRTRSTTRRTSRWSAATSATARTCWCACTRSA